MDNQVTAALIGLGGVVVGAVIAAFVGNLRPNIRTVLGVARLLHADLTNVSEKRVGLPTELWNGNRQLLASELGKPDWDRLREGYEAASKICDAHAKNTPLAPEANEWAQLACALAVLSAISGRSPWFNQMYRRSPFAHTPSDCKPEDAGAAGRGPPKPAAHGRTLVR